MDKDHRFLTWCFLSIHHHLPLGSSDHECLTWQYECVPDTDTDVSPCIITGRGTIWLCVKNSIEQIGKYYFVITPLILIGFPLKKR